MTRTWNPKDMLSWAWVQTNLKKPYGLVIEPVLSYGKEYPKIVTLKMEEIVARIQDANPASLTDKTFRTVPNVVGEWMRQLNIASMSSLSDATKRLPRDTKLRMLADWFNGGNGLPSNPDREEVRLYLTHPSLLNEFLSWVCNYLRLHDSVDGRVNKDNEALINAARATAWPDPLPPVERY